MRTASDSINPEHTVGERPSSATAPRRSRLVQVLPVLRHRLAQCGRIRAESNYFAILARPQQRVRGYSDPRARACRIQHGWSSMPEGIWQAAPSHLTAALGRKVTIGNIW
jgi:hypothetical protein